MTDDRLTVLVIGAHPDDCDVAAGGTTALWRQAGHAVHFVSLTDGSAGHHEITGPELVAIRKREAEAAGRVFGVRYDVLDHPDGLLVPSLEARLELIRLVRRVAPDLLLTHRPNDYHPDHRYTSQLVCDAAYLLTVPAIAPEVESLPRDPVIAYVYDNFTRPYPFSPTVAVDIEPVMATVVDALDCHASQFYEWLPHNMWQTDSVPADSSERRVWLGERYRERLAPRADQFRSLLVQIYGAERASAVEYIEAFEPCEYGAPLDDAAKRRLFPFLPWNES